VVFCHWGGERVVDTKDLNGSWGGFRVSVDKTKGGGEMKRGFVVNQCSIKGGGGNRKKGEKRKVKEGQRTRC